MSGTVRLFVSRMFKRILKNLSKLVIILKVYRLFRCDFMVIPRDS